MQRLDLLTVGQILPSDTAVNLGQTWLEGTFSKLIPCYFCNTMPNRAEYIFRNFLIYNNKMLFKMIHIKRNNYFGLQDIFVTMCRHLSGCNSAACKFRMWMYASGREEKNHPSEESCYSVAVAVSFACYLRALSIFTEMKNWKESQEVIWSILLHKDNLKWMRTAIHEWWFHTALV